MPARTGRQRSGLLRSAAEAWTLALLLIVYGLWAALALVFPDLPLWLSCPLLVLITVQFMSIQHEIVHGHPTRSGWLNEALVSLPLGLLFPYRRYRTLHLRHHNDENLTDPFEDPESWYFEPEDFARQPAPVRWLWRANATLLGRLLLGPVLSVVGLVRMDLRTIFAGDRGILWDWVLHLIGVSAVLALLSLSGFSLLAYLAFVALPSMSVLMIRSFAEHRASEAKEHRTAIIPDRGLFALLFLNNNLHAVHHAHPTVAWYRLPRLFREQRAHFEAVNGGYGYRSYFALIARHLLRPVNSVAHPIWHRGNRTVPLEREQRPL